MTKGREVLPVGGADYVERRVDELGEKATNGDRDALDRPTDFIYNLEEIAGEARWPG